MFEVVYRKSALKTLAKMPKSIAERFLDAFSQMADGMNTDGLSIKPLQGQEGFRLRIGDYRAIYTVEADRLIIEVIKIGSRGDIYK